MKRLYLSLIVTLVIALFSVGWLLDQVFYSLNDSTTEFNQGVDYRDYRTIARGLAKQLDDLGKPQQLSYIENYNQYFDTLISVETPLNFSLPLEVTSVLNEQSLVIDSDEGVVLLHKVNNDLILQMELPPLPKPDRHSYLLSLSLYLGLCFMAVLWLIPLINRLNVLDKAAKEFSRGDFKHRVTLSSSSYIKTLEVSFNKMAQHIDVLIEDNKLITGALAHDLRHPASCIRFGLESIRSATSDAAREVQLEQVESDLDRLDAMVSAFLDYSRIERQDVKLRLSHTSLATMIDQALTEFELTYPTINLTLIPNAHIKSIRIDPHWVNRAINNLLINAAQQGVTEINVSLNQTHEYVALIIEDNGPGIEASQRDQIFKPFVCLDTSRGKVQGNYGLGLAIVSRIMEWHHGSVGLTQNVTLAGAAFELRFTEIN